MKWHVGLGLLGLMVFAGCGKQGGNSAPETKPIQVQTSPWLFTSTSPADNRGNHGVYLSNGVIGVSLGPFGPDINSSSFLAGVYDSSENLLPIPLFDHASTADPVVSSFDQTLDIQHGTLTTTFTDANGNKGRIIAFASRADRSLVVFRYEGAAGPLANRIKSIPVISGSFPGIRAGITVSQIKDTIGTTVIGRIESPISPISTKNTALKPFETLLREHQAQWVQAWKSDIIIDGAPEAQRVIHKALFDLRQSAAPKGSNVAIAPEGLAGNFYKGHIFWDADVWMLPALLPFDPDAAMDIVGYRDKVRKAVTPWESAHTGTERAPSGFSDGRHVTADVGYGALLVLETSKSKPERDIAMRVLITAADELVKRGFKSGPPSTFGKVTGPDELNMGVQENAYTNAMAKRVLLGAAKFTRAEGKKVNPSWEPLAKELVIPMTAEGQVAKCLNDDGRKTKQADGELALWPGLATNDEGVIEKSFDFHKVRPIKNGPAMTDAIHALIAARLGRTQEAEENFLDAYKPFIRGPFMLFSEKRSMDRCVFVTGLGGLVQAVVYGYAGLDLTGDMPAAVKKPALPASWKTLTLQGIHHRGQRYDIRIDASGSTIKNTQK